VIADPDDQTKVFGSYFTRHFFKSIKSNPDWEDIDSWSSGIYCGKSMYDVADKFTERYNKILTRYPPSEYRSFIMTMDGSSHDAHQHELLMKLIDVRYVKHLYDDTLQGLDIGLEIK